MNRRVFFKLVAGAAALAAVPNIGLAKSAVTIFADGINDDGPGLNALLRGEVVEFAKPEMARLIGWRGNTLELNGIFRLDTQILIDDSFYGKKLEGGVYKWSGTGPAILIAATNFWIDRIRIMEVERDE
jgi:hypothetical protein